MTGWDDGYVSDVVYTKGAFREMTPVWLATAAILTGHRPPDLSRPFRYADLGCGHGLTATIVAATYPQAEVWGFDFNPAHIESARLLADRAELSNLHFREASFAELAALDKNALPEFDFIVSHGVLSWISAENRALLFDVVGQRLRAGGLAYHSYNVATGWASMVPVRALMRALVQAAPDRSDQAVPGLLDYLDILKDAGTAFFPANPTIAPRLNEWRKHDPHYLAHEFLNADWHPLMHAEVAAAMQAVKCRFIGSATLPENIDAVSVPQAMTSLVTESADAVLRETLRDFGLAQQFRRDIFRRGVLPLPAPERARLIDGLALEWSGQPAAEPIELAIPVGTMHGSPELYRPIMDLLRAGRQTIASLRTAPELARQPPAQVLQAALLLIANGYAHPAVSLEQQEAARAATARLNAAICECNANGEAIPHLAAAAIGSATLAGPLEMLVLRERLAGRPLQPDGLTGRVLGALTQSGRSMQRDGQPIGNPVEARAALVDALGPILADRLPLLERLGAAGV